MDEEDGGGGIGTPGPPPNPDFGITGGDTPDNSTEDYGAIGNSGAPPEDASDFASTAPTPPPEETAPPIGNSGPAPTIQSDDAGDAEARRKKDAADFVFNQDPQQASYDETTGTYTGPQTRGKTYDVPERRQPDENSRGFPTATPDYYNEYFSPSGMDDYFEQTGDAGPVFPDMFRRSDRAQATTEMDRLGRNGQDNFTPFVMDGDGNWTLPTEAERIRVFGRDKAADSQEYLQLNPATGLPDSTINPAHPTMGVNPDGTPRTGVQSYSEMAIGDSGAPTMDATDANNLAQAENPIQRSPYNPGIDIPSDSLDTVGQAASDYYSNPTPETKDAYSKTFDTASDDNSNLNQAAGTKTQQFLDDYQQSPASDQNNWLQAAGDANYHHVSEAPFPDISDPQALAAAFAEQYPQTAHPDLYGPDGTPDSRALSQFSSQMQDKQLAWLNAPENLPFVESAIGKPTGFETNILGPGNPISPYAHVGPVPTGLIGLATLGIGGGVAETAPIAFGAKQFIANAILNGLPEHVPGTPIPIPEFLQHGLAMAVDNPTGILDSVGKAVQGILNPQGAAPGSLADDIASAFTQDTTTYQRQAGLQQELVPSLIGAVTVRYNGGFDIGVSIRNPVEVYQSHFDAAVRAGKPPEQAALDASASVHSKLGTLLWELNPYNPAYGWLTSPLLESGISNFFGKPMRAVEDVAAGVDAAGLGVAGRNFQQAEQAATAGTGLMGLTRAATADGVTQAMLRPLDASGLFYTDEGFRQLYGLSGDIIRSYDRLATTVGGDAFRTSLDVGIKATAEQIAARAGMTADGIFSYAASIADGLVAKFGAEQSLALIDKRLAGEYAAQDFAYRAGTSAAQVGEGGIQRQQMAKTIEGDLRSYFYQFAGVKTPEELGMFRSTVNAGVKVVTDVLRTLFLVNAAPALALQKILDEAVRASTEHVFGVRPLDMAIPRAFSRFAAESDNRGLQGVGNFLGDRSIVNRQINAGLRVPDQLLRDSRQTGILQAARGIGVNGEQLPTGQRLRALNPVTALDRALTKFLQSTIQSPTQHVILNAANKEFIERIGGYQNLKEETANKILATPGISSADAAQFASGIRSARTMTDFQAVMRDFTARYPLLDEATAAAPRGIGVPGNYNPGDADLIRAMRRETPEAASEAAANGLLSPADLREWLRWEENFNRAERAGNQRGMEIAREKLARFDPSLTEAADPLDAQVAARARGGRDFDPGDLASIGGDAHFNDTLPGEGVGAGLRPFEGRTLGVPDGALGVAGKPDLMAAGERRGRQMFEDVMQGAASPLGVPGPARTPLTNADRAGLLTGIQRTGQEYTQGLGSIRQAGLERGFRIVGNTADQTNLGQAFKEGVKLPQGIPGVGGMTILPAILPFAPFHIHSTQFWLRQFAESPYMPVAIMSALKQAGIDDYGNYGLPGGGSVNGITRMTTAGHIMDWALKAQQYFTDLRANPNGNGIFQQLLKNAAYNTVGNNPFVAPFGTYAGLGQSLSQGATEPLQHTDTKGRVTTDKRDIPYERGAEGWIEGGLNLAGLDRDASHLVGGAGNLASNLGQSVGMGVGARLGGGENIKQYNPESQKPYFAVEFAKSNGWSEERIKAAVNNPQSADGKAFNDAYLRRQDFAGLGKASPLRFAAEDTPGKPVYPDTPHFADRYRAGEGGKDAGIGRVSKEGNYYLQDPEDGRAATARAEISAKSRITPESVPFMDYARDYLQRTGNTFLPNRTESQATAQRSDAIYQGSLDANARKTGAGLPQQERVAQIAKEQTLQHEIAPGFTAQDLLAQPGNYYDTLRKIDEAKAQYGEKSAQARALEGILQGIRDANIKQVPGLADYFKGLHDASVVKYGEPQRTPSTNPALNAEIAPGFQVRDFLSQPGNLFDLDKRYGAAKDAGASKAELAAIGKQIEDVKRRDLATHPQVGAYFDGLKQPASGGNNAGAGVSGGGRPSGAANSAGRSGGSGGGRSNGGGANYAGTTAAGDAFFAEYRSLSPKEKAAFGRDPVVERALAGGKSRTASDYQKAIERLDILRSPSGEKASPFQRHADQFTGVGPGLTQEQLRRGVDSVIGGQEHTIGGFAERQRAYDARTGSTLGSEGQSSYSAPSPRTEAATGPLGTSGKAPYIPYDQFIANLKKNGKGKK